MNPGWKRFSRRYFWTGLSTVLADAWVAWILIQESGQPRTFGNVFLGARFVLSACACVAIGAWGIRSFALGAGALAFVSTAWSPDGTVIVVRGRGRITFGSGRNEVAIVRAIPTGSLARRGSSQWTFANGEESIVVVFLDTPSDEDLASVRGAFESIDPRVDFRAEWF